jgi:hypothetical protein
MNVDIVALVKASMEKMGCGHALAHNLDAHSPICIAFRTMPEIFVEQECEHVKIWSMLNYCGESQLARAAFDLLSYPMPHSQDIFTCGRPVLSRVNDTLLLFGRVEPRYLSDADLFTQALESFYEDLCVVSEILKR